MKSFINKFITLYLRLGLWKTIKLLLNKGKEIHFSKMDDKIISIHNPDLPKAIYLRSDSSDYDLYREIFIRGEYDIDFMNNFSPEIIFDFGANIGLTSLFFHKKYPFSRIFAFEPDKSNYLMLTKNVEFYQQITSLNKGVWYEDTILSLIEDISKGKWGITTEPITNNSMSENVIPVISVNSIIQKFNIEKINLLKIDIEGAEKMLFTSNVEWLQKVELLFIECHDMMKKGASNIVFKALKKYDFHIFYKGENIVAIHNSIIKDVR